VGEAIAAKPILLALKKRLPDHEIVLSTTTSSGQQTAREQLAGCYDHLVYFPIDLLPCVATALRRAAPEVVVVMETELWLNFLFVAKRRGCNTLVANGRISDRSFGQSGPLRGYYAAILRHLDRALMQDAASAERIRSWGGERVEVLGNVKFDTLAPDSRESQRGKFGFTEEDFVVVVGSTRGEEEEDLVLSALDGLDAKCIFAPRHVERADAIAAKGTFARWSRKEIGPLILLDTYGELADAYAAADVAVVGGGFLNLGGQNLIQALAAGVAVLHGPHMQNFRAAAEASAAVGAARTVRDAAELRQALAELRASPEARQTMGQAGRRLVAESAGAAERYAEAIAQAAR
jgi:3-deoxy-D-manno-octulosonic-acid transferase